MGLCKQIRMGEQRIAANRTLNDGKKGRELMSKKGKIVKVSENAQGALEIAFNELESLRDEMGEWADNMESSPLEHTEKCQRVREAADTLDNAVSELESKVDEIEELLQKADADGGLSLASIDVSYTEFQPYKGRSLSRSDRMSNARDGAVSAIEAARPVIEAAMPVGPFIVEGCDEQGQWSWMGVAESEEDATYDTREEADSAIDALVGTNGWDRDRLHVIEGELSEETEAKAEALQEALDLLQECEAAWAEVEDVEFPGMFG